MDRIQILPRVINSLLILLLLAISPGLSGQALAQPDIYFYANGVQLPAAVSLPVFQVTSPTVNQETSLQLANSFDGINNQPLLRSDEYLKLPRFTILNEANQTILEQYGATGGFYAYNPDRAFGKSLFEGTLNSGNAQLLACQFLQLHSALFSNSNDLQVPGLSENCTNDFNAKPLYKFSTEYFNLSGSPTWRCEDTLRGYGAAHHGQRADPANGRQLQHGRSHIKSGRTGRSYFHDF